MPITLGTNIASLRAQRKLTESSDTIRKTFERLSSGLRINKASDDAAGLAIADSLNADKRVYTQASRNLTDGVSALSIAEGALSQLSSIVTRQIELAEQAGSGTFSAEQRASLNTEAQALADEYNRILESTEFNGQKLLDGSLSSLQLQGGVGEDAILDAQVLEEIQTTIENVEGLGTYTEYNRSYGLSTSVIKDPQQIVADINNDGIDDIITAKVRDTGTQLHAQIAFFLGEDGTTEFTRDDLLVNIFAPYLSPGLNTFALEAVDRDADGDIDLEFNLRPNFGTIVQGWVDNRTVQNGGIFDMDENEIIAPVAATNQLQATVEGDFNNDGVVDTARADGANGIIIGIQDTTTTSTTTTSIQSLTQESFSLTTASSALSALDALNDNLDTISTALSTIGASQSRIGAALNVTNAVSEQFATAESRIRDADIASESSQLVRESIKRQAASAVLAQANVQPALALQLLDI